nr:hypothetical protein [uncultured Flavobacterium sp.]
MQKEFKFNDKADYIFYLAELITDCYQKTDRLKNYGQEIEQIILSNPNAKIIQTELYESISDKVTRLFQYIFNLLGDESKKAVSFRKFRKRLYKDKNKLNIELEELSQNELKILGEFNTLRNWGLHIPESLFIQKKEFFKMDSQFIETNKMTIPIPTYDYFEIQFLTEMKREIGEVIDSSMMILERMKNDYSVLIGEPFKIEYEQNQYKPYLFMTAVQNSWNSQNGK